MKLIGNSLITVPWRAPIAGGSNLYCAVITPGTTSAALTATAETYCIANYKPSNSLFDVINNQLKEMIAQGQRSIRIPICWTSDLQINATDGSFGWNVLRVVNCALSPIIQTNLTALLMQCVSLGFEFIEIASFPEGGSIDDVTTWTNENPAGVQNHWNFWVLLRQLIYHAIGSYDVVIKFDLYNELAGVTVGNQIVCDFAAQLWANYVNVYGANDCLGFSMAVSTVKDAAYIASGFEALYENPTYSTNGIPSLMDAHVGTGNSKTDQDVMAALDAALPNGVNLVLGEMAPTPSDAYGLAKGSQVMKRQVWLGMVWNCQAQPVAGRFPDILPQRICGW